MNFIQVNYDLQKFGYMVERKPLTARETDEKIMNVRELPYKKSAPKAPFDLMGF